MQPMYQVNMSTLPTSGVTIPPTWGNWNVNSNASNFTVTPYKEYAIKGELLTVKYSLPEHQYAAVGPEGVKKEMALMMAEAILEKHIEFTKLMDPLTLEYRFHARVYLAPKDQVQILRVNGY
jgi:hypothetical protein